MARTIITIINEEEKTFRTGLTAADHLRTLPLKTKNPHFEQEVTRKLFLHKFLYRTESRVCQNKWH